MGDDDEREGRGGDAKLRLRKRKERKGIETKPRNIRNVRELGMVATVSEFRISREQRAKAEAKMAKARNRIEGDVAV